MIFKTSKIFYLLFFTMFILGCSSQDKTADQGLNTIPDLQIVSSDGSVDASLDTLTPTDSNISHDSTLDQMLMDTGVDSQLPQPMILKTTSYNCSSDTELILRASKGENGHLFSTRLTPPSYPFVVESISYNAVEQILAKAECRAHFDHKVEIYVGTFNKPEATPTPIEVIQVAATQPTNLTYNDVFIKTFTHKLKNPLELKKDENIFIAIEMRHDPNYTMALCINESVTISKDSSQYYWSNTASPPYNWGDLASSFGVREDHCVQAQGYIK